VNSFKKIIIGKGNSSKEILTSNRKSKKFFSHTIKKKFILNKKKKILEVSSSYLISEINKKLEKQKLEFPIRAGADITIGGAISSNVHGKDSFKIGNIYHNLLSVKLKLTDNKILEIDRKNNLFNFIVSGYGLIGIILSAKFRLKEKKKFSHNIYFKIKNKNEWIKFSKKINHYDSFVAWAKFPSKNFNIIAVTNKFTNYSDELILDKKKLFSKNVFFIFNFIFYLVNKFLSKKLIISFYNLINLLIFNFSLFFLKNSVTKNNNMYDAKNINLQILNFFKNSFEIQILVKEKDFLKYYLIINNLFFKHNFNSFFSVIKKHKKDNSILGFSDNGFSINFSFIGKLVLDRNFNIFFEELINIIEKKRMKIYLAKYNKNIPIKTLKKIYNVKKFINIKKKFDKNDILTNKLFEQLNS
tara:strand:- start:4083 stop:5324 length:1242 start_codon:yes stop_codon:yes gene_type:complete